MTGIKYFIECLNENRHIENPDMVPAVLWWIIAPTEKMAKQNWKELKHFFPKELIVSVADSTMTMETIGDGEIEVRSGYDGENLVGRGVDLVTLTEAARFKDLRLSWANIEARLNSPGRGRKKDRLGLSYGFGKAIINSSPLGKNDFYDLWCFGQETHANYSSLWWSAQYPWTANPSNAELAASIVHTPHGDMTYEESLKAQLTERTFRSNYMADFTAEQSNVFQGFSDRCVYNPYSPEYHYSQEEIKRIIREWQTPKPYELYVGGYDPATGSSSDTPAFIIREISTNRVVRIFDLYGKKYEQQYDFIAAMCKTYNYAHINWLRTGHTAIEGEFAKRGIQENPIDEAGGNKAELVQNLELAVQNGDVHVINDQTLETRTLILQMDDYSEHKGKYSNDKLAHDDFVSAMYAAWDTYNAFDIPVSASLLMAGSIY